MAVHVLVVDDSQDINRIIEMALSAQGYDVMSFQSGMQAMAYLDEHSPDLVLLDIMLPDVNGVDLLPQIKAKKPFLPVVMMTAFGTVETAVEAMKAGAEDYLCKPFKLDNLLEVVEQNVNNTRLEKKGGSPATLEDMERSYIQAVLQEYRGNRRKAAEALGISLRTLYYKIKQFDLE